MSVEHVDIESLKPAERPFTDATPAEGLMDDIKRRGIQQPLLVDGSIIVDGIRRWTIARELGHTTVPVLINPTFQELMDQLTDARSEEDFRTPYTTRWFDLVPLWNYISRLGSEELRLSRKQPHTSKMRYFPWARVAADRLWVGTDTVRKAREALAEAKKRADDPIVQEALRHMREGTLGPAGLLKRITVHIGHGMIRSAEEHAKAYQAIITNLQANERLIKSLGRMEGEMDPEVHQAFTQELNRLVGDHRRLVNRLQGVVRVRYKREEPTA